MGVFRVTATLFALAVITAPIGAQLPQFGETIEVRVINIDAVVTGPNGIPVRGLGVDDFELLVDGKPVPISHFAAVEDGQTLLHDPEAPEPIALTPAKPYLAIVWDRRAFRPREAKRALDGLIAELPLLVEATDGILVAHQGRSLKIEQTFTNDLELLSAALGRLDKRSVVSTTRGERSLLLSRLERAANPEDALTAEQAQLVQDQAEQMLREINILAQQEQNEAIGGLRQLRHVVNLLSNLPGRKGLLYFGRGVQTRPAEAVYRMWWQKYRQIAGLFRVPNLQSQVDQTEVSSAMVKLLDAANHQRVAFYSHDTGGNRATSAAVEFATVVATTSIADEQLELQQALLQLATSTGGLGTLNISSVEPLLERMVRDFRSYYSIGFEAADNLPSRGRIQLRLREGDFQVRHFDRYDGDVLSDELDRATMTALITRDGSNPLGAQVEVGEFERRKNGNYLIPILVKVPISQLTLLPEGARHVGKLSVVVLAQSAEGDLSQPAHGEVPIEIDNGELLAALSRLAGYRLQMEVSAGEQVITIGLRDDVAHTLSTVNLSLSPGKGS